MAVLRPDHPHHVEAREAVARGRQDDGDLALPDFVLAATVRLLTSSRVLAEPNEPAAAMASIAQLLESPGRLVSGSPGTWRTFDRLVRSLALRGNDIPDAALAAVCLDGLRGRTPSAA